MPYITQARRELVVTQQPPEHGVNEPLNAGELTYQLTVVVEAYRGLFADSFGTYADIVAALEQAKDEFQRRVVHPYEAAKCKLNGDCYDLTAFEPVYLPPACTCVPRRQSGHLRTCLAKGA